MKELKDAETRRIGAKIKEIRREKGISQKELALSSNISMSHMSEIESGRQVMMLPTFAKIVDALNISADDLLLNTKSETRQFYEKEFSSVLSDCTPEELDSILRIVREIKTQIHAPKTED